MTNNCSAAEERKKKEEKRKKRRIEKKSAHKLNSALVYCVLSDARAYLCVCVCVVNKCACVENIHNVWKIPTDGAVYVLPNAVIDSNCYSTIGLVIDYCRFRE